ncbi:uncharacterized protein LOC143143720 isoform X7 [Ptiloglossa arizonensis]|uniref:uncharacterized protein LOC143143720 isoform X7 n=1 Tax=Ptiloglossa arizonensis TaxID=3350558 RepID=UPI003FA0A4C6
MQFFLSLFFKQYWHIECSGFGQLGQLPFRWNRKQLLAREWIIGIQPIYAVIATTWRSIRGIRWQRLPQFPPLLSDNRYHVPSKG